MKLSKTTIYKYKSFINEQSVDIEPEITRIVGKNESGKSAFLEAIAKSNYYDSNNIDFKFNKDLDYPRSQLIKARTDNPVAVSCEYTLDDEEISNIEVFFAKGILRNNTFSVDIKYNGTKTVSNLDVDFGVFKRWIIEKYGDETIASETLNCNEFQTLLDKIQEHQDDEKFKKILEKLQTIDKNVSNNDKVSGYIYLECLESKIPKFWYFSDYFSLPARINLDSYENWINQGRPSNDENAEGYGVVSALFDLSGLTVQELKDESNFESFTATLEATSNLITDEMFEYWRTNENLQIEFKLEHNPKEGRILNIRIKNTIHRVTLPLKNRACEKISVNQDFL